MLTGRVLLHVGVDFVLQSEWNSLVYVIGQLVIWNILLGENGEL